MRISLLNCVLMPQDVEQYFHVIKLSPTEVFILCLVSLIHKLQNQKQFEYILDSKYKINRFTNGVL